MTVITPEEAERKARAALAAGQLEAAESLARALLAKGSGPVHVWSLLASAVRRQGRIEEAATIQKMLVEANPGNYDLHFDLAESLLLLGEFERGWREYHYRYRLQHTTHLERKVQTPRWDGRPIPGKTLLIHDEQGFGDTFQFMRMVPWAKERSQARLVLQITPEQEGLARRMGGFDDIVLRGQLPPRFDIHCEMMSLPMAMGLQLSELPGPMPYLTVDRRRLAKWKRRLAKLPRPLVALNWAGRPNHFNDANRSMTLATLAPLAMPGVTFLSVQKGPKSEQTKTAPAGMTLVDLGSEIDDFDDTAAIFSLIDLLISVDSSPVHLAGALNRPAWVMLPFVPDWRWLQERDDTPWYPSVRLFRQKKAGDWPDVVRRMALALAEMAGLPEPVFPEVVQATPALMPVSSGATVPVLKDCRHGRMLFLPNDLYVGRSLDLYGEFSQVEGELLQKLVGPGDHVVEIGANIGAHTVGLARRVGPGGTVHAFEPQRVLFQMLCANVALNGLGNVHAHRAAVGVRPGSLTVPPLDYAAVNNFGGISLTDGGLGEKVTVVQLDGMDLPPPRLLKIDVEGMEADVLEGARQLITRQRPVLYVENDRREKSPALITLISDLGYDLWWHLPPLFNPGNFAGNANNVFGGTCSINLICLPREAPLVLEGFKPVKSPDDWPWDYPSDA